MKIRTLLTAATAAIALASPALADEAGKLLVDQAQAKITTAKADANVARFGAAELNSAELLVPKLRENIDDDDKTDTQSLIRQIDALVETAKVKAELAAAKETAVAVEAAGTRAEVASAKAVAADAKAEAAALRSQLRAMQMKQTAAGATLVLQDVVFSTGSAALRPGSMQRLQPLVSYLNANANVRVRIDGHTDSQGSTAYNESLSQRRAEAVRAELVGAGIAQSRIDAVGHGEAQPVATNANAAGRQQNRRVEITLLGQRVDAIG